VRIDHVIYATPDLDATAARLADQLGLPVTGGGRHEGLGTENRIIALGGGYLEVLGVADAGQAAASPFGRAALAREGLIGWVVGVDDVAPVAARLGTEVTTISRAGLTARLPGVAEAMAAPSLPFFIARDAGVADPGDGAGAGIAWIELSGDADALRRWLGDASLPVRVVDGPPAVRAVAVGPHVLRG